MILFLTILCFKIVVIPKVWIHLRPYRTVAVNLKCRTQKVPSACIIIKQWTYMWHGLVLFLYNNLCITGASLHSLWTSLYLFLSQAGYFARVSHAMLGFRRGELIESVEATPVCARWHFLWVNLQKILAAAQLMQSVRNAARPSLSCQSLLAGFTEALLGYKESSGKAITISSILKPCTEIL